MGKKTPELQSEATFITFVSLVLFTAILLRKTQEQK